MTWVEGALDQPAALARLCGGAGAVIHVAGAINAPMRAAFFAANADGTAALLAQQVGVPDPLRYSTATMRLPGA